MLVGVLRFPGIVDNAAGENMLATSADIDVVAHRVDRNNPLRFAVFRAEHHPGLNRLSRLANINGLPVDINLAAGYSAAAE